MSGSRIQPHPLAGAINGVLNHQRNAEQERQELEREETQRSIRVLTIRAHADRAVERLVDLTQRDRPVDSWMFFQEWLQVFLGIDDPEQFSKILPTFSPPDHDVERRWRQLVNTYVNRVLTDVLPHREIELQTAMIRRLTDKYGAV